MIFSVPLKRAEMSKRTSAVGTGECLITPEALSGVFKHAISVYPFEMCGVLLRKGVGSPVTEYRRMDNCESGAAAMKSFAIDPLLFFRREREWAAEGLEVAGFCHSHPDAGAVTSSSDVASMVPGLQYMIVSVSAEGINEVRVWQKKSAGGEPVGIPVKVADDFINYI